MAAAQLRAQRSGHPRVPADKDSVCLTDEVIEATDELPARMRKSVTWGDGFEMATHAALTLATHVPYLTTV